MQSSDWWVHRWIYKSTKGKGKNKTPCNAYLKTNYIVITLFHLLVEIKLLRYLHEDVRIEVQLCHE